VRGDGILIIISMTVSSITPHASDANIAPSYIESVGDRKRPLQTFDGNYRGLLTLINVSDDYTMAQ